MRLVKIAKSIIVGAITAATVAASNIATSYAAAHAAQAVFNHRGYSFRDVQFTIPELQDYSVQVAERAIDFIALYQAGIFAIAIVLITAALAYPEGEASKRSSLFQRWKQAVLKNDSLTMATIEAQVRDESE